MIAPINGHAFDSEDGNPATASDFPIEDVVTDFAGRRRTFVITAHEGPIGYRVQAHEKSGDGYEIDAFDPDNPYYALGKLRQKMRRLLSTRHIEGSEFGWSATHDMVRGRIACVEGNPSLPAMIVDGVKVSWEEFGHIVATHEGFDFALRLVDPIDELP